jgi:hypothetical protein
MARGLRQNIPRGVTRTDKRRRNYRCGHSDPDHRADWLVSAHALVEFMSLHRCAFDHRKVTTIELRPQFVAHLDGLQDESDLAPGLLYDALLMMAAATAVHLQAASTVATSRAERAAQYLVVCILCSFRSLNLQPTPVRVAPPDWHALDTRTRAAKGRPGRRREWCSGHARHVALLPTMKVTAISGERSHVVDSAG